MSRSVAELSRTEALWHAFLGREVAPRSPGVREFFAGRRVLITGAGGSIGSAVARAVAGCDVDQLALLDTAEHGLYALEQQLAQAPCSRRTSLLLGSVADDALIAELFATCRPEIVFHAAALKHVPLVEANPIAGAHTNVLGTETVLRHAAAAGTRRLVHLSTDKAVAPASVLGATKRVAECLVLANRSPTSMAAVRLPNVLGSSGSVGPLFLDQIARQVPLTVTDAEATRFFLSEAETVAALLQAAMSAAPGVLVPHVGTAHRILDLARFLLASHGIGNPADSAIRFTGLRPGDKLHERMISSNEVSAPVEETGPSGTALSSVTSIRPADRSFDQGLAQLRDAVSARDRTLVLQALARAVPGYTPAVQRSGHEIHLARETFA